MNDFLMAATSALKGDSVPSISIDKESIIWFSVGLTLSLIVGILLANLLTWAIKGT